MSSKKWNSVFGTVVFRLTLLYSLLLVILALVVFGLIYVRLTSSLNYRMDSMLTGEAKEFEGLYEEQGLEAIKSEFQREAESGGIKTVFFRMFSPELKVLASSDMSQWRDVEQVPVNLENLSDNNELLQTVKLPGRKHSIRVIYRKTANGDIFEIGNSLRDNEELMERYRQTFGWAMVVILVLGTVVGWSLASRAMSGVKRVTQTAIRIGRGDITHRVSVGSEGSEIHDLALAFNDMLEHIQSLVTELREVTNNIAHDLRSPITRIRGIAETTLTGEQNLDACRQMSSSVIEECDRLVGIINTMLDIAEAQSGAAEFAAAPVNVAGIAEEAYELFQPAAEDKGIELELDVPAADVFAVGDVCKLQRVMANLLDNAISYTEPGGRVVVSVEAMASQVRISVADNGVGISEEDLPHIFERFYRADRSRSSCGNGLGLSLADAIINAHNGEITVESSLGEGSVFTIILPSVPTAH